MQTFCLVVLGLKVPQGVGSTDTPYGCIPNYQKINTYGNPQRTLIVEVGSLFKVSMTRILGPRADNAKLKR